MDPVRRFAPPATDWLRNTLSVVGLVADVARFRALATGSGVVP